VIANKLSLQRSSKPSKTAMGSLLPGWRDSGLPPKGDGCYPLPLFAAKRSECVSELGRARQRHLTLKVSAAGFREEEETASPSNRTGSRR